MPHTSARVASDSPELFAWHAVRLSAAAMITRLAQLVLTPFFGVALALAAPRLAQADVQKNVSQEFPGRVIIGVHPIGYQVNDDLSARFKVAMFDIAGLLGHAGKLGVWLGGGISYAGPSHDLQPWMYVMLTFERFLNIPLVPSLRFGAGSDVFLYNDAYVNAASLAFKIDFGLHYYLTRNIGVGFQSGITTGPVFYHQDRRDRNSPLLVSSYASHDFNIGARFAF